jgi:hypothetical protein
MHFGFNNQFIKVMRTLANISKKSKYIYIYIYIYINVWDYEFIRKT